MCSAIISCSMCRHAQEMFIITEADAIAISDTLKGASCRPLLNCADGFWGCRQYEGTGLRPDYCRMEALPAQRSTVVMRSCFQKDT
jgi:hypothetical protein